MSIGTILKILEIYLCYTVIRHKYVILDILKTHSYIYIFSFINVQNIFHAFEKLCKILVVSQLRICKPPPPLIGGHLDIKDGPRAENKDGRTISYHIISRPKEAFWATKNSFLFKIDRFCKEDWN